MFLVLNTEVSKVHLSNRIIAKVMDLSVVMFIAIVCPYPLGPLIGFFYSLFADGVNWGPFHGQSVGKKIMGLKVIHRLQKRPPTYRESALRNLPVGVATFFSIIPIWGWFILAILGVPLMAIEIYLMYKMAGGHRLGDVMGDTEVVLGK